MAKITKQIIEENIFCNLGDEKTIKACSFFQRLFLLDELEG